MAFIFRRRAAQGQRGAELEHEEANKSIGSPGDKMYLSRSSGRKGVSATSVIVALLILIAVLGLMLVSGI